MNNLLHISLKAAVEINLQFGSKIKFVAQFANPWI
jgi:hypothetical protein